MLGPATVAAHLLFADETGVRLLRRTDTCVVHCPAAVSRTSARMGPLDDIEAGGIRVGWATDWASMNPWDAMRADIVGRRVQTGDPLASSAREALWRFTMGSAEILGLADEVGSLEVGKAADLVLVDVDRPHLAPMYDPFGVLVYNASARDVADVLIGGEQVVENGRPCRADVREVVRAAQTAADRIWRAGASDGELAVPVPRLRVR